MIKGRWPQRGSSVHRNQRANPAARWLGLTFLSTTMMLGTACSHEPSKVTHAFQEDLAGKNRILPPGDYETNLDIVLHSGKAFRFRTVVALSGQAAQITGYRFGSGTKVFTITEDLQNQKAKLTLFQTAWEPLRESIEEVYVKLRPMLFRGLDAGIASQPLEHDQNGVPRLFTIKGSGYDLAVRVTSYQLN